MSTAILFPSRPLRVIQRKQLNIFFVKIAIRDLGCRTFGLHWVSTLSSRFFVSHWSLMTWENFQKKLHPSTGMLERNNIKPLARVIYVSIEQRQKTVFVFFILTLRSFEWEWILCKSKLKHQEGDKKGLQKSETFCFLLLCVVLVRISCTRYFCKMTVYIYQFYTTLSAVLNCTRVSVSYSLSSNHPFNYKGGEYCCASRNLCNKLMLYEHLLLLTFLKYTRW